MKFDLSVYIGRFQPPHLGHLETIQKALEISEKLLILIGDYRTARSIKNPFYFEERKEMIQSGLEKALHDRIHFEPVRNYPYNDNLWVVDIQRKVSKYTEGKVGIVGNQKDSSSYYLNLFPQWEFAPSPLLRGINATNIREYYFEDSDYENAEFVKENIHPNVIRFLSEFKKNEDYLLLREEYSFLKKYKAIWESAPFPPTFVTVDSVVMKSGHILLVKRKSNPGKGLWALPGGFVRQNEFLFDGAIRELSEETGIKLSKQEIRKAHREEKVFDRPDRSLRGRTITHAYFFDLGSGDLPSVREKGGVEKAIWVPIIEVYENIERFYEDHFAIIEYFIYKI
ncbi:MAG: bifunctional nicotinamide-nucleotide adenylyltransferase/Nudix hydroxylase [Leptospiraceae bacterium]|nr:bifunctional nicotinamide-nucleotide adenylyltransferase/Nudix hydroxylase [Leptospiraceae bacterium]MCP5511001.1 bifunctional nicotinamide-nucleotide adenylyltransferase/Nudix hydroxylase [Leptospiraceae bacterium]